ncbi:hypothetical protein [Actinomyces faecalis]|uniref:hypothetical protein n=1 Tax=Actinomyces faecalis TaxID=2722820 RepID=UPI00155448C8|nr:hypothetical protein [Actinomyces faecalis]
MSAADTVDYVLTGSRAGTTTRHVMAVSPVTTRTLGGPDRPRVTVRRLCQGKALARVPSDVGRADRDIGLAASTGRLCGTCLSRWTQAQGHADDTGAPSLLDLVEAAA